MHRAKRPRANKAIRVVIFSKYTLLREGIKALLRDEYPIEISGEAATTAEAIALLHCLSPDIILMDPIASELSGARAMQVIKDAYPHVKVLLLAMNADESLISDCMHAGASGYIRTTDRSGHLKHAIAACVEEGKRAA